MILIAVGSNRASRWGTSAQTVARAARELAKSGIRVTAVSGLYRTAGVGPWRQTDYVNAVIAATCWCPPGALLRRLKRIERAAGYRSAVPWGPRALDLDILDYKGLVRGWGRASGRRPNDVVLPHPGIAERPFVLGPLSEIAPDWRHPVLGRSARELNRSVARKHKGRVLQRL